MASKNSNTKIRFLQILILLLLIAGTEYAVNTGKINRLFLASPSQSFEEFLYMTKNQLLWSSVILTIEEAVVGYLLSALAGVALGILFVSLPTVEKVLSPYFSALMAIPKTAIMPLLIVWFGVGFKSKVVLVMLFCTFTVLFNTVAGAKQTKQEHLKVMKAFGANRWQCITKLYIPSALPSIFSALRITAASAITGVIFAEIAASRGGIGYLLNEAQAVFNTPRLYLLIIIATLVSVAFVKLINLLEYAICHRWQSTDKQ